MTVNNELLARTVRLYSTTMVPMELSDGFGLPTTPLFLKFYRLSSGRVAFTYVPHLLFGQSFGWEFSNTSSTGLP